MLCDVPQYVQVNTPCKNVLGDLGNWHQLLRSSAQYSSIWSASILPMTTMGTFKSSFYRWPQKAVFAALEPPSSVKYSSPQEKWHKPPWEVKGEFWFVLFVFKLRGLYQRVLKMQKLTHPSSECSSEVTGKVHTSVVLQLKILGFAF